MGQGGRLRHEVVDHENVVESEAALQVARVHLPARPIGHARAAVLADGACDRERRAPRSGAGLVEIGGERGGEARMGRALFDQDSTRSQSVRVDETETPVGPADVADEEIRIHPLSRGPRSARASA